MTRAVYAIGERPGGPVKIGFARNLESRCSSLQHISPVEIKILASAPGAKGQETFLHLRFSHLQIRGEWFRDEDEQITKYIRKHGSKIPNAYDQLAEEMAAFERETGAPVTVIEGWRRNDPGFPHGLGETRGIHFRTVEKIRAFMAEYRAAQAESA